MSDHVLKRGLKNIFAAEIIKDDGESYETGTPFHLIPAGEMSRTVDSEKADVYYDDTVFATVGKEGATEVSITGAALRPDALAKINNKNIDATTGAVLDTGEFAPKYFALGGETENLDGTKELFWFMKGTFAIPEQSDKTKDDSTDTNGMSLTYSAVQTQHLFVVGGENKPMKRVVIDTSETALKASQSWTAQVVTPENLSTIVQKVNPGTARTLTITQDDDTTVTVTKGGTPLASGATIYDGDVLTISVTGGTITVNGSAFTSGNTHTVTANVTVVSTASE